MCSQRLQNNECKRDKIKRVEVLCYTTYIKFVCLQTRITCELFLKFDGGKKVFFIISSSDMNSRKPKNGGKEVNVVKHCCSTMLCYEIRSERSIGLRASKSFSRFLWEKCTEYGNFDKICFSHTKTCFILSVTFIWNNTPEHSWAQMIAYFI